MVQKARTALACFSHFFNFSPQHNMCVGMHSTLVNFRHDCIFLKDTKYLMKKNGIFFIN
jgi:hypothetical protein